MRRTPRETSPSHVVKEMAAKGPEVGHIGGDEITQPSWRDPGMPASVRLEARCHRPDQEPAGEVARKGIRVSECRLHRPVDTSMIQFTRSPAQPRAIQRASAGAINRPSRLPCVTRERRSYLSRGQGPHPCKGAVRGPAFA